MKKKRGRLKDEKQELNPRSSAERHNEKPSEFSVSAEEVVRFFSLATDMFCVADHLGRFLRVNDAWQKTLGYRSTELIQTNFIDLVHPDDRERSRKEFRRLLEGQNIFDVVTRYRHKNGSYRSIQWRATPYETRLFYGIGRDITDRIETENRIKLSENRYRFFMDNLQGIAYQSAIGTYAPHFMHGAVKEITGYDVSDFLDKRVVWYDIIHGDDRAEVNRHSQRLMREPNYFAEHEYRIIRKDGAVRWVKDVGKNATLEHDGSTVLNGLIWDVTERKTGEEKFRRDDAFRRAIIDRAAEGMLVCHQVEKPLFLRFTVWNNRMKGITGYTMEDINRGGLVQLLYPDQEERRRVAERIEGVIRGDDLRAEEWGITCKDGTRRTVTISSAVIRGDDGEFNILGLVHDLTERKQAEELLRKSEERLRSIFRASPVGIGLERDCALLQINDRICEMTGYSERELIGRSMRLFYPDDKEFDLAERAKTGQITEAGVATVETRFKHKDGRVLDVLMSSVPLDADDHARGITFAVLDVTERKRASEALRAAVEGTAGETGEAFFKTMVRSIAKALDVRYAMVAELRGNPPAELTPIAAWINGEFYENFFCRATTSPYAKVIHDGLYFCSSGLRRRFPDNETLSALDVESFFGVCLFDANQEPIGILAVMDTWPMERASLTESLLTIFSTRAAAELQRTKAEENRLKLEAQIQHVQKLESLGVLAGGIAHDFNNLLMVIIGNADLARRTLSPASPGQVFLQDIETASHRAAELCNQMLAYSGKGRFVVQTVDLNLLVEEMTRMLEVSISKKAVLKYSYAANLPAIEADATQVRQVLMNLITNASEAIGDRSGIISITTGIMKCEQSYLSDTFLDESLREGLYVFLEVADTGCGMTEQVKAKLFDPFFSTKFTGRGLGMAAVLGIVRGHEGTIKIYTEVGKGTTVKVLFPASKLPVPIAQIQRDSGPQWRGQGAILVVDDEDSVLVVTANMLELMGFQTLSAKDGEEALKIYRSREKEIVCVLLDLTMPHMDGEETFRELRRINREVRVIMSSGYNEQEVTQRFVGKGLAGFIQKPYHYEKLEEKLRAVLKR
ncbi:MAG: PAS domain S-box protein [Deltaproteobacteria bacterium]|nr:PAS domain S-box protein [Deltaproteobacteria bacterium]